MKSLWRVAAMMMAAVWLMGASIARAQGPEEATAETLRGVVHLPGGSTLECIVKLTPGQNGQPAAGTIDIPMQGLSGSVLHDVAIGESGDMRFTLKPDGAGEGSWARFVCRRYGQHGELIGQMKQGVNRLAVTFTSETHRGGKAPVALTEPEAWRGVIHLPGGQTLNILVDLTPARDLPDGQSAAAATMSIPQQGLDKGVLHDVAFDSEQMRFVLRPEGAPQPAWAQFMVVRSSSGETGIGVIEQMGNTLPVEMERIIEGKPSRLSPQRPQTPKPPFPYTVREVTFPNDAAGITLAGTLTVPEGDGPHPAVVLISGSGPQDRNETIFGHEPFWVLADHLSRRGIAVLRFDDRGVGDSGGNPATATSVDFAGDVVAGMAFLKQQSGIDPRRIGLIGHSEGGIIAPMVAVEHPDDIAFIVLLAGTGVPGRDILILQSELMARATGMTDEQIAQTSRQLPALLDLIVADAPDEAIAASIRAMAEEQARAANLDPASPEGVAAIDGVVQQQTLQLASPWMRWFVKHDPRTVLKRVRQPVLALNGGLDMQVSAQQNLSAIAGALKEGGNTDITVTEIVGLNHLFQTARTGSVAEYAEIEETMSPLALDTIADWVRKRSGLGE